MHVGSTRLSFAVIALAAGLILQGCVKRPPGAPKGWPATGEWIIDGRTGEPSTFAAMIEDLSHVDVVFVGEDHDNPLHHEQQGRILTALIERRPEIGFGMEMLQIPSQPIADRYSAGELDLDAFAKETDWRRTWGFPIAIYKPVLDPVREHHVSLFALNAKDSLVHHVAKLGIDGLTPEEKAEVPELDLTNEDYKKFVGEAFEGHHEMPEGVFQKFFTAQVVWDETMASRTTSAMKTRAGSSTPDEKAPANRPMMVIAGTGHLIRRMGIPSRVERRVPGVRTRVVLPLAVTPKAHPDFKKSAATKDCDWVVVTLEQT